MAKRSNYKGNKTNNKRSASRNTTRSEADNPQMDKRTRETSNDINWWNKSIIYPEVVRVPFNRITGDKINRELLSPNDGTSFDWNLGNNDSLPTITRFDYVPFIGVSKDLNSPINRAFTSLYAALYSKTTGAMQFQQADMAITVMAVDSILTNIAVVRRALGLSSLYSDANYSYPRGVLTACGIDPDTVIGRQDEIRRVINDHIANLNSMRIPQFITVFDRHYALAHNLYMDENDVRAQLYTFVPTGGYFYYEAGQLPGYETETLGYSRFNYNEGTVSIDYILDFIGGQLSAIRHSTSFGLVMGTIMRAFPQTNMLTISPVMADSLVMPVCDRNILWQINNMVIAGQLNDQSLSITCDPLDDALICRPKFKGRNEASITTATGWMLNSYDGNTDDEFVMESTRLIPVSIYDVEASSDPEHPDIFIESSGTEVVESASIYAFDAETNLTKSLISYHSLETDVDYTRVLNLFTFISNFKIKPTLYYRPDGDSSEMYGPMNDFYRYTTVDHLSVEGLHEAALLSAYSTSVSNVVDQHIK